MDGHFQEEIALDKIDMIIFVVNNNSKDALQLNYTCQYFMLHHCDNENKASKEMFASSNYFQLVIFKSLSVWLLI